MVSGATVSGATHLQRYKSDEYLPITVTLRAAVSDARRNELSGVFDSVGDSD